MSDVGLTYTKRIINAIILCSYLMTDNLVVIIILARRISVGLYPERFDNDTMTMFMILMLLFCGRVETNDRLLTFE